MKILPHFATKEGVLAIGELGYDEQTALEDKYLRAQIELAKEVELPMMIYTPHRDKKRGTLRTMDVLAEHKFDPAHCVVDHNNEETVEAVLDRGYFVGFSIYPQTKMSNERMTEIVRQYGSERIIVDSACDWGVSDPLAVPKTAALMAQKGIDAATIHAVTYTVSARGLRPFRRHEGRALARAGADRPAHAVRGQQRAARRPDATDRDIARHGGRFADRVRERPRTSCGLVSATERLSAWSQDSRSRRRRAWLQPTQASDHREIPSERIDC